MPSARARSTLTWRLRSRVSWRSRPGAGGRPPRTRTTSPAALTSRSWTPSRPRSQLSLGQLDPGLADDVAGRVPAEPPVLQLLGRDLADVAEHVGGGRPGRVLAQ